MLSRLLNKYTDAFQHLGIQVRVRRSNGCIITLSRLDASSPQSSAEASAKKSKQEQDLQPKDDIQARVRRLEAKKKHKPPSEEK